MSFPLPTPPASSSLRLDVRTHGATGDGRTLDTAAFNRALAAAAAAGGGVVRVPAGDYLCHSIRLRSGVTLEFESGATLIAAAPPPPGEPGGYDAPEEREPNLYQDYGHSRFRNSLLWGENLTDVALVGPGVIFGRGLSRGNSRIATPYGQVGPQPPGHLPDVLEADGPRVPEPTFAGEPGPFGYPHALDTLPSGVGNKALALVACRGVTVRGLTFLHAGHFAILATHCDQVVIEDVLVDTNRDGIDIDGCAHVRIARCRVNSPWDDGICLKSSFGAGRHRPAEHITIENCYVSGFVEGTLHDGTKARHIQHRGGPIGRIKLGTESGGGYRHIAIRDCEFEFCRGLALEQVDGSIMEDIDIRGLKMREVMNAPIFIRLGARLRGPGVAQPGSARRIAIRDVVAHDVAPDHGIFIAGLPGFPVEDVALADIAIHSRGGHTAPLASVPELPAGYPEPMLFGPLPAWGFYARHACGLRCENLTLAAAAPDGRAAVWLDDVADSTFRSVRIAAEPGLAVWQLQDCRAIAREACDGA